ncbi:beta-propeller domain-containing protein [Chloroflexota bacterium]
MSRFSSYQELEAFLATEPSDYPYYYCDALGVYRGAEVKTTTASMGPSLVPGQSIDYLGTNNQVVGVDEADIIKTDGEYIYYTVGTVVYIVKAYPAVGTELVSEIELDGGVSQMYVNGDRLVLFEGGGCYGYWYYDCYSYAADAGIKIYDISNRANPVLIRDISTDGNYTSSRMIGDYVYVITNDWIFDEEGQVELPEICIDGSVIEIDVQDIYYSDVADSGYGFTTVMALNVQYDLIEPSYATMLLGSAGNVYVSTDNIYITLQQYTNDGEVTQIHRFSVDGPDVSYTACGQVPGKLLNQFSMDEHNGYFRVATTVGRVSKSSSDSMNNLYVLDMDLQVVGTLEDLAPGESIYSTRFMGSRCYLVTFKKVDPFFVIDLSDPYNPEVLGELKITGYSDYLHPYDENHVIGIGKETIAAEEGDFAWYQGVKISLFDVTDVSDPVEIDKYEIGDRGTDTPVLHDHKAFLFDRERNLLVMPVMIAEVEDGDNSPNAYGRPVWQGAYVFDISVDAGIDLKGGITHHDAGFEADDYWHRASVNDIRRSLYIEDVLYTVSDSAIKLNDIETLDYISQVELS